MTRLTEDRRWVPGHTPSLLVLAAPVVAVVFCFVWSSVAWSLMTEATLQSADGRRMALFWASQFPMWIFGLPMLILGCIAFLRALWEKQGWLCLLVVLYYGPGGVAIMLASIMFARVKPLA